MRPLSLFFAIVIYLSPRSKPFVADAIREKSLVLTYLRFPEITEVCQNIANDRPLTEKVLSEWEKETFESFIQEFLLPRLLEANVISRDAKRASG